MNEFLQHCIPLAKKEERRSQISTIYYEGCFLLAIQMDGGGDNDTAIFYPFQCIEVNTEFAAVFSEL